MDNEVKKYKTLPVSSAQYDDVWFGVVTKLICTDNLPEAISTGNDVNLGFFFEESQKTTFIPAIIQNITPITIEAIAALPADDLESLGEKGSAMDLYMRLQQEEHDLPFDEEPNFYVVEFEAPAITKDLGYIRKCCLQILDEISGGDFDPADVSFLYNTQSFLEGLHTIELYFQSNVPTGTVVEFLDWWERFAENTRVCDDLEAAQASDELQSEDYDEYGLFPAGEFSTVNRSAEYGFVVQSLIDPMGLAHTLRCAAGEDVPDIIPPMSPPQP